MGRRRNGGRCRGHEGRRLTPAAAAGDFQPLRAGGSITRILFAAIGPARMCCGYLRNGMDTAQAGSGSGGSWYP